MAILTSTGGAGTLVSDSLGVAGFETPAPDPETAAALRALQTGSHAALDRNPIDVTLAGLQPDLLRGAIKTLLASPTYDALTIIVGSSGLATPELMADAIQRLLAVVRQAGHRVREPARAGGWRCSDQPRRAGVHRGRKLHRRARRNAAGRPVRCARATSQPSKSPKSRSTIFRPGSLDEAQAKALFARFGVPVAREKIVSTPAEAKAAAEALGGRVVLKILSGEITHKSDVGGVAVNLTTDNDRRSPGRDGQGGRGQDRCAAAALSRAGDGIRRNRADPRHASRPAWYRDPARHGRA